MNERPLTQEAALVVGLATTALPFAVDRLGEVQRWLRLLGGHGAAGAVLAELGLTEQPELEVPGGSPDRARPTAEQTVAAVCALAQARCAARQADELTTADLLAAVAEYYGSAFDRLLAAAGTTREQLSVALAARQADEAANHGAG